MMQGQSQEGRETPRRKLQAIVADDSDVTRDLICRLLQDYEGVEVIAIARNGKEAVESVRLLQPDLVLMDVNMPEMNGLRATQLIKEFPAPPKVLVISFDVEVAKRASGTATGPDAVCDKLELHENLWRSLCRLFPELEP